MSVIFVCSGIVDSRIISEEILTNSKKEAENIYFDKWNIIPIILGPYKEKINNKTNLKFINNKPRKAIYKNWRVNAFDLAEPPNHSYIVFIEKIGNSVFKPNGTLIVPFFDLRTYED